MTAKRTTSALVKLSRANKLTICLIREELKSHKFFNGLRKLGLGLDSCHYQPNLDELIIANIGLDNQADETYDFYYNLIEKHSEQIEPNQNSISLHALNVYLELIMEKKRRGE